MNDNRFLHLIIDSRKPTIFLTPDIYRGFPVSSQEEFKK
jgi:hypothetical protein